MYPSSKSLLLSLLAITPQVQGGPIQQRDTGCGKTHNFIGSTSTFSIESSGGTRSYRIHLPSSYNINKPTPLLVAYHGSGDNPTSFEQTTRFSDEKLNPNMITVYPQGVNVRPLSISLLLNYNTKLRNPSQIPPY